MAEELKPVSIAKAIAEAIARNDAPLMGSAVLAHPLSHKLTRADQKICGDAIFNPHAPAATIARTRKIAESVLAHELSNDS
jgi:hypothetical protein